MIEDIYSEKDRDEMVDRIVRDLRSADEPSMDAIELLKLIEMVEQEKKKR